MIKFTKKAIFLNLVLVMILSCVTVNIYFPAAAVEKAADKIVKEVWEDKGEEEEQDVKKENNESFLDKWVRFAAHHIGPQEAFAQEADINITTPAIRALKNSIKKRAPLLKHYLDKGNVGIANDGLLVIRSTEGMTLKAKAQVNRLIHAENNDRNALYKEIAKANNFGSDQVSDIKIIFAKSWKKNAKKGWWVEEPGGTWNKK